MRFARFLLPLAALAGLVAIVVGPQACTPCHGSCSFSVPTWDESTCSCTGGLDAAAFPAPDATVADGAVDAAAPSACPTVAPTQGTSCDSPGAACPYSACKACVCASDGTWLCPQGDGDCERCPESITPDASCATAGLSCTEWAFCGANCACSPRSAEDSSLAWECPACSGGSCGGASCGGESSCPTALPTEGDACEDVEGTCTYPWVSGCVLATCACTSAKWSCSYADNGCEDP